MSSGGKKRRAGSGDKPVDASAAVGNVALLNSGGAPMAEQQIFEESAGARQTLDWREKDRFRKMFAGQATRSFVRIALGMGLIALALPIALLVSGIDGPHYSISHYYYAGDVARSFLVGSLWTTGIFLILFQGLSRLENVILRIGGGAAIGVAMFPMGNEQCGNSLSPHFVCAILFFICLAVVAVGLSKGRVKFIIYPPLRKKLIIAYNVTGTLMIAMPASVAAIHYLAPVSPVAGEDCNPTHWIFWLESVGIWAFSAYWFVKMYEYQKLLGVRWTRRD